MYIYQVKAFGQQCYNLRKFQFRFVSEVCDQSIVSIDQSIKRRRRRSKNKQENIINDF